MKKLFVGRLPFATTEDQLRDVFNPYGPIASCKIITDRDTGRSRGFGFVELEDDGKASEAITALNGTDLGGFEIVVSEAREGERSSRPPRSGGGGGGGFGGGGRGPRGGGGGGFRGGDRGGDRGGRGGDRGGRGGNW